MRKIIFYSIFMSLWMCMTSCMGDGSGTINYHRVGVVHESPRRCIYTTDDQGGVFIISSPEFDQREEIKDGDCCEVDFKTNFSEDLGDGVYKAEIFKYDSVAVWPLHDVMTDTTRIMNKEQLVKLNFKRSLYLDGHLFLFTEHQRHQEGLRNQFHLSYDPKQRVETGESGERIYNLFLRVTQDGQFNDSIPSTRWLQTSSFQVQDFLRDIKATETQEGKSVLNFKINYVDHFNADTTGCVWAVTDVITLRFSN